MSPEIGSVWRNRRAPSITATIDLVERRRVTVRSDHSIIDGKATYPLEPFLLEWEPIPPATLMGQPETGSDERDRQDAALAISLLRQLLNPASATPGPYALARLDGPRLHFTGGHLLLTTAEERLLKALAP